MQFNLLFSRKNKEFFIKKVGVAIFSIGCISTNELRLALKLSACDVAGLACFAGHSLLHSPLLFYPYFLVI
jgi:hypothetical protein